MKSDSSGEKVLISYILETLCIRGKQKLGFNGGHKVTGTKRSPVPEAFHYRSGSPPGNILEIEGSL